MTTKTWADFQICISVLLTSLNFFSTKIFVVCITRTYQDLDYKTFQKCKIVSFAHSKTKIIVPLATLSRFAEKYVCL